MQKLTESRVLELRKQFPALSRLHNGHAAIYLDGPAGTQVPLTVADSIRDAMLHHNANRSGKFATSREVDAIVAEAQSAAAAWVGSNDPDEIVFGPNMTTLTFHFSRSLSRNWMAGDEVVVTRLDHDANHTPWIMAARDRGVTVKTVDIHPDGATLDVEDFRRQLSDRTRLVAFTAASNSVGSLTPVSALSHFAHEVGAEVYVDAVHYAPHGLIDVQAWDCDYLVCSAYKFFGPHIGILWGRKERLETIEPYKLRPAPDCTPGKWMTGTQNHACLTGVTKAIQYIADVCPSNDVQRSLRERLRDSFEAIGGYERHLVMRLIAGLQCLRKIQIYGLVDSESINQRVPTIAFTLEGKTSAEVAAYLDLHGIYAWHGNYYALSLSQRLGREPDGMVRMGLMHTNTVDEVDRTLSVLSKL